MAFSNAGLPDERNKQSISANSQHDRLKQQFSSRGAFVNLVMSSDIFGYHKRGKDAIGI